MTKREMADAMFALATALNTAFANDDKNPHIDGNGEHIVRCSVCGEEMYDNEECIDADGTLICSECEYENTFVQDKVPICSLCGEPILSPDGIEDYICVWVKGKEYTICNECKKAKTKTIRN